MNSICSRTLKISTLALSVFLASCGEDSSQTSDNKGGDEKPSGQVVAVVNGEEITIHELNNELVRLRATDETREMLSRDILKSLVTRILFEQNAKKSQIDRSPNIMMELERTKSTILAKAYIQSQLVNRPTVSRRNAETYVFDNPQIFSDRAHYIFDTLVVSNSYLTKEKRETWELVTNLDEIESVLLGEGVEYKRIPYSAHTEQLSASIRNNIDEIKLKGDVFYMILKNNTYINIYKESRPAVLTGEAALSAAMRILSDEVTKAFLVKLEADAIKSATVEYLGDFKTLTEPDSVDETAKDISDAVQKPVITPRLKDDT